MDEVMQRMRDELERRRDTIRDMQAQLDQAREALKWLVYLHCGVSKFNGEMPITSQEWEEAIESGREALAAMEATS